MAETKKTELENIELSDESLDSVSGGGNLIICDAGSDPAEKLKEALEDGGKVTAGRLIIR